MGVLSAAMLAEYQRANPLHRRSLELVFPDGTKRYSSVALCSTSLGFHEPRIRKWGQWGRAWGDRKNAIQVPEARVEILDHDKDWVTRDAKYNLRGSTATVRYLSPNVGSSDWLTRFLGVLAKWDFASEMVVSAVLRPNDFPLYSPFPKIRLTRRDFTNLPKASDELWAPVSPYGRHDSFGIGNVDGQIRPVYVGEYTEGGVTGSMYVIGWGRIKSVLHAFSNGTRLSESTWNASPIFKTVNGRTWARVLFNSNRSSQDITLDVEGIEATGDGTGALISDACDQIKHFIVNYIYNEPSGLWLSDSAAPISTTYWAETKAFLNDQIPSGYKGGRYIAASKDQTTGVNELNAFCHSNEVKPMWTLAGLLAIRPDRTDDPGYQDSPWFRRQYDELASGPMHPVKDDENVVRRVLIEGGYSEALGQYQEKLEVVSQETDVEASDTVSGVWLPHLVSGKTPPEVASQTGWWRPEFNEALADGDGVQTWRDQSGNGFDFSQGTAGNRPVFKLNQRHGYPALDCNEAHPDYMDGTDFDNLINNNAGVVIVAFHTNDVTTKQRIIGAGSGLFLELDAGVLRARNNDGANQSISRAIAVGPHVVIWWHNASTLRVYVDDPLEFSSIASGLTSNRPAARIGANEVAAEGFKDLFFEAATFSAAHSDANLSAVFAKMAFWLERGDPLAQMANVASRRLLAWQRPRLTVQVSVPLYWLDVEIGDSVAFTHPFLPHPTGQGAGIERWRRRTMVVTEAVEDMDQDRLSLTFAEHL